MAKTVVALYTDFDTARSTVEALVDAGFDRGDISLIASDSSGEYARYFEEEVNDEDVSASEGAGFGAVVGALVGLGVALIPGIGPVVAAGPLAAALMAGIGAASGAVTGGIVAGLVDFGVPEEHAARFAEGIRRGGTLVMVQIARDEWANRAQSIMNQYDPVDINERDSDWQSSGWTDDQSAVPMTGNQVAEQQQAGGEAVTRTAAPPKLAPQPYSFYEPRFRTNYNVNYVDSGYDFAVFEPAYRYGYTLATNPRYEDYSWPQLEPDAERYWIENYPGVDWDRVKNCVRDAWEDVTGR